MCPIIKSELREKLRSELLAEKLVPDSLHLWEHENAVRFAASWIVPGATRLQVVSDLFVPDGRTEAFVLREFVRRLRFETSARGVVHPYSS